MSVRVKEFLSVLSEKLYCYIFNEVSDKVISRFSPAGLSQYLLVEFCLCSLPTAVLVVGGGGDNLHDLLGKTCWPGFKYS